VQRRGCLHFLGAPAEFELLPSNPCAVDCEHAFAMETVLLCLFFSDMSCCCYDLARVKMLHAHQAGFDDNDRERGPEDGRGEP
jgi:hypothetical protein